MPSRTVVIGGLSLIAIIILAMVLISVASDFTWNVAVSDSEGNQGPQGAFEVSIFRCAPQASPPAQPSGGRWDVSAHHIQDLPADWYTMVPACTGNDVLFQSFAEVNPALGAYINLQWNSPYEISVSQVQSDWLATTGASAILYRPVAAYSYYPSWYDVTTTNPPSDEEFYWGAATVPATWDAVLSIIVDGNTAYKESTGSTTLARGPPLTRLASGTSYVVILDDTGAAYGAYKVGPKTGTDPLTLRLTHYRSAGTPPTDTTKRVEVRYYPDGVSRLAANVNADWNATGGDAQILNKPVIPSIGANPQGAATGGALTKLLVGAEVYSVAQGGSGDITAVNVTAPITGGGASGDVTIGISAATTSAAGSMSAADYTKLDGIETGAQANAPRLVKFDAVDSDIASHENSEIGFYSGSAQIVNTSITGANRIYIPLKAAPFGTNASDANTPQGELDDVDLQPFFNDRLDNGGQIMLAINKHGTGDYTYVQADTIAAHGSTGWLLTALTWYGAAQMATGSGWDIVAGDGGIFTKDIIDRDRLVFRADLEGRETDRYLSYNSSHSGYWPGAMAFYNQSSGIPTAANIVGQTSLADGTLTLGLGRLRTDRDPLNLVWDSNTCPVAADYAVGDAIYISSWRTPSNHATFTITSAAVQTGTGNGCYVYMAGTLSGAAAIAPVTAIGDYLLLAEEVPTQVQVEIPFSDVLDPPWVRTDGTNATDALEAAIQGCDETITLTGTYERRAGTPIAKGQWYIPATPTRTGQQQLVIAFKDTDLGRIVDCWITDAWIEIGGYEMEVVDSANFFQKSINAYQGAVVLGPENTGTIPSVGDSDTGKIIGEDVHRGQLDDIAFTGLQRHGTALPSTCAVGLVFLLTAASGNNTAGLYACLTANTWTAVGP